MTYSTCRDSWFSIYSCTTPGSYMYMYCNSLSVQLPVDLTEPTESWLVGAVEPVMEVDQRVVLLHILVQSVLEVPGKERRRVAISSLGC